MGDKITPIQDENESFVKIQEVSNTSIIPLYHQENKETNLSYIIDVSSLSLEEEKESNLKFEEEQKEEEEEVNNQSDEREQAAIDVMDLQRHPSSALLGWSVNQDMLKITNCPIDEIPIYEKFLIVLEIDKNVKWIIKQAWKERRSLKCNYALDEVWTGWQIFIPIICGFGAMFGGLGLWGPSNGWAFFFGFSVFCLVFFIVSFINCKCKNRHLHFSEYYS